MEFKEGIHEEGVGYSPNGEFCGECSSSTCKGCVIAEKEAKEKYIYTYMQHHVRFEQEFESLDWALTTAFADIDNNTAYPLSIVGGKVNIDDVFALYDMVEDAEEAMEE